MNQPKPPAEGTPLPCPFCGKQPKAEWSHIVGDPARFTVSCEHEGTVVKCHARTKQAAFAQWNRRAAPVAEPETPNR